MQQCGEKLRISEWAFGVRHTHTCDHVHIPCWDTVLKLFADVNQVKVKTNMRKYIIFRSLAHGLSALPLHPDTS